jgi:hypothetical protein
MTDMTKQKTASQLPGDEAEEMKTAPEKPEKESLAPTRRRAAIQGNDELLRHHRAGTVLPTPESQGDESEISLGELTNTVIREFTVERDGNLPLQFAGYLVGWNEVDPETVARGTRVCVYVTRRGKIITSVHQWQRDTERGRERHNAGVHETAKEALAWLIRDGGDHLGRASREAWALACQGWPALQGHEVEVIE